MPALVYCNFLFECEGNSIQLRQGQIGRYSSCLESRCIETVVRKSFEQHTKVRLLFLFDSLSYAESGRGHQDVVAKRLSGATSIRLPIAGGIGTEIILPPSLSRDTHAVTTLPRATSRTGCSFSLRKINV